MHNPLRPRTPQELLSLLVSNAFARLYVDITLAAGKMRLTEHAIATIERRLLDELSYRQGITQEDGDFDIEAVFAAARHAVRGMVETARDARQQMLDERV